MKIKTSELTDAALDHAVMQTLDLKNVLVLGGDISYEPFPGVRKYFRPSESWAQSGPIIEREKISPSYSVEGDWIAYRFDPEDELEASFVQRGPTPLIAAMRCYVASKLGDEVEVPDELA